MNDEVVRVEELTRTWRPCAEPAEPGHPREGPSTAWCGAERLRQVHSIKIHRPAATDQRLWPPSSASRRVPSRSAAVLAICRNSRASTRSHGGGGTFPFSFGLWSKRGIRLGKRLRGTFSAGGPLTRRGSKGEELSGGLGASASPCLCLLLLPSCCSWTNPP